MISPLNKSKDCEENPIKEKEDENLSITSQSSAHMDFIIIPAEFCKKSKVGNKENIPLIWGLPQAGCEGNFQGPLF